MNGSCFLYKSVYNGLQDEKQTKGFILIMYYYFKGEKMKNVKTPKVENYSADDTAKIVAAYEEAGTDLTEAGHNARAAVVEQLAKEYGKSVRSIRSKLVLEKVYIKRGTTSAVTGEKPEKKEVIAENLVKAFGSRMVDGELVKLSADSLAKANKQDLAVLFHYFNSEIVEDSDDNELEEIEPSEMA